MMNSLKYKAYLKQKMFILFLLISFCLPVVGQGRVDVDLLELKEQDNTLQIVYNARISPRAVKKGERLRITPILEGTENVKTLPAINIIGNNRKQVMQRKKKLPQEFVKTHLTSDTLLKVSLRIPYEQWMEFASLVMEEEVTGYRASTVTTRYRLKDRIEVSIRTPYEVAPKVTFITPAKEDKMRYRQGKAYLDFQVGRSVILPNYRCNSEELLKIDDVIRDMMRNPDATIQGVYIEGYASPEGTYATNDRLSKARAEALKSYILQKFKVPGKLFKVSHVGEDWDGLVELVKASKMPQKEQVLRIIETIDVFDGREKTLMELNGGIPYRWMLKEIFPKLRRVEYQIDYVVKDYDLSQAQVALQRNPDNLSQLELYSLAMASKVGSSEFNRILIEVIPKYYPNDPVAINNAAAALIQNGELATARRFLQKAGQSAAIMNNSGVLHLLEGDLDQAEKCFIKAYDAGCRESEGNLEEVKAKRNDNKKLKYYQRRE